jgi:hypothetical protein
MERQRFVHRLYVTDLEDRALAFAGSGFAVNPAGDVVTCRHVVDRAGPRGEELRIGIWDGIVDRMHHVQPMTAAYWPGLDLAVLPRAFGSRWRGDYLSLLASDVPQVGAPVVAWGSYSTYSQDLSRLRDGYFEGAIVSREPPGDLGAANAFERIILPFPVIEGLSGSPLLMTYNGAKVAGVCFGSESSHVQAYESSTLVRDGRVQSERTERIVEFGLAYPSGLVAKWLEDAGVQHDVETLYAAGRPGTL